MDPLPLASRLREPISTGRTPRPALDLGSTTLATFGNLPRALADNRSTLVSHRMRGYIPAMLAILLVLLLAIILAGVGFAVHVLWIIAAIVFLAWLVGWGFSHGATSGRRQWWGRW
jgi:hypothetical protein